MSNKTAAASGNSIAVKSFMSFTVSDDLLQKIIEAVKSGEHEARTSGGVKSFEIFSHGFRQQISIGRLFIIPARVCDKPADFPTALLYGTVVRELNLGEETADLIARKTGDTEFDDFAQIDFSGIKDRLFTGEDGKLTSLIIFAPSWAGIREYIGFKFVSDETQLSNLLRHLVFSAYYSPNVSSAFDALMTTVDTHKLDITDITPKLTYPFLSENPLRAYPDLSKQGGWAKPKIFLTKKTADAITKEVLDPQELNVFEALDSALTEATFPQTDGMEEVADFKGPSGSNEGNAEVPEVGVEGVKPDEQFRNFTQRGSATDHRPPVEVTILPAHKFVPSVNCPFTCKECNQGEFTGHHRVKTDSKFAVDDGTELRHRPDYGEKGSFTQKINEENAKAAAAKLGAKFDFNATKCPDCGETVDAWKMCPHTSSIDANRGQQFCGRGAHTDMALQRPRWQEQQPTRQSGSTKQADTADNPANEKEGAGVIFPKTDKEKPVTAGVFEHTLPNRKCDDCGKKPIKETVGGRKLCSDCASAAKERKAASAPFETPFTNVGPGASAHDNADKSIAVKVDTIQQKGDPKTNSPIGIAIDETGVARRPEEERKAASVAHEIMRDLDDGYSAMSATAKAAAQKHEAEMNKKYAIRRKVADVPLTEDSIWNDLMEDFGAAPQVELPGEGAESGEKALPEAMTSNEPEKAKATAEKSVKPVEKALESPATKKEPTSEPKSDHPKSKLFGKGEGDKKEAPKEASSVRSAKNLSVPEKHQLRIALDTVKNPAKAMMGYPNVEEAKEIIYKLTGRRVAKSSPRCPDCRRGVCTPTIDDTGNAVCGSCGDLVDSHGNLIKKWKPTELDAKKADAVQPDYAEAKSKVVSPATVDTDIKQPTKSVEEAAKVSTVGVKTVKVVGGGVERTGDPHAIPQYYGEHGCRTYVGETNTQGKSVGEGHVCMKPEVVIHDGRMYCEKHRPAGSRKKTADLNAVSKGRGFGKYVIGEEIHDFTNVHVGDLLLEHSNQFDSDNTIFVSRDEFPESPHSRIWAHFVNPEDWEERWGEDFCIWAHELGKEGVGIELWRATNTPEFSEGDKIGLNGVGVKEGSKKIADVSGDVSEAKSKVVSPSTVDSTIKQPTESVEEAAKVAAEFNSETLELAKRLIESNDDIVYDVAANVGQIVDNVKHMRWFVEAVAEEISGEEETVRQHLDAKEFEDSGMGETEVDEHRLGVSSTECPYCGSVDCDFDCDESQAVDDEGRRGWNNDDEGEGKSDNGEYQERILNANPHLRQSSAGDDQDEAVEMSLEFGDLADLAVNLPLQVGVK